MDNFLHSCRIFAEKNKDMEPQEYYRLYPELRRRRWYGSLPVRAVMNYIIRNAFARPCRVFDIDLSAGSLITFYSSLAEATHLDFWQVKRALNQLNDEGDLSITPSGLNMILTLTHFPLQTQPQPKELTGTEVGAQYIAPAQAAQSNKLNRNDVGTLFKASAEPEQTFTTESSVPLNPPRNSHHSHTLRRKAPKKSRIRGDTIVGTGVSPCKSTAHLHKPRSGDIFIRSPSY